MRGFRKFLLYTLFLIMAAPVVSSCGTTKNERIIKKIERQSKRNPAPHDDNRALARSRTTSRTVRKALKKEEKRQRDAYKAALKAQEEAIKRHQDMQTPETRARMERNLKETNRSTKPETFFSRLFRPNSKNR